MSRSSRNAEDATSSEQLKKELKDAAHSLQVVGSRIQSMEKRLVDSKEASQREATLKSQINDLESRVEKLREEKMHDEDAFAIAVTKLDLNFGKRVRSHMDEIEHKTKEEAARSEAVKKESQHRIDGLVKEIESLRKSEVARRREWESQTAKQEALVGRLKAGHQIELENCISRLDRAEVKVAALDQEVEEQAIMLKGRDTEIGRLKAELASVRKFSATTPDSVRELLQGIHNQMHVYCDRFLESSDTLPGWHPLPKALISDDWPRVYSLENDSSRTLVSAILHHSVCEQLMGHILVPIPFSSAEAGRLVADTLYRLEPSHEAIWRSMAASSMLENEAVISMAEARCRKVGAEMIATWKLHSEIGIQNDLLKLFVELWTYCLRSWLQVMACQERIVAVGDGRDTTLFNGDDASVVDQTKKIPGEFGAPSLTSSVLCLLPAFFHMSGTRGDTKQHCILRGTCIYANSKMLMEAREGVAAVKSPRSTRRMTVSSTVS